MYVCVCVYGVVCVTAVVHIGSRWYSCTGVEMGRRACRERGQGVEAYVVGAGAAEKADSGSVGGVM